MHTDASQIESQKSMHSYTQKRYLCRVQNVIDTGSRNFWRKFSQLEVQPNIHRQLLISCCQIFISKVESIYCRISSCLEVQHDNCRGIANIELARNSAWNSLVCFKYRPARHLARYSQRNCEYRAEIRLKFKYMQVNIELARRFSTLLMEYCGFHIGSTFGSTFGFLCFLCCAGFDFSMIFIKLIEFRAGSKFSSELRSSISAPTSHTSAEK